MRRREFFEKMVRVTKEEGADAASSPQSFRVGYQIYSWGRHYPESWWRAVDALEPLGFRGIEGEYTIAGLYEGREGEFRHPMARGGMDLAALYSTTDFDHAEEFYVNRQKNLAAARFAKLLGTRVLVVGGTDVRERSPEAFRCFARQANAIGQEILETTGLKVGIHPHLGSLVQKREDIDRVMETTDPRYFFLCPDTAHLAAGGSDPVEVFRTYASRIIHTHFKDYRPARKPGEWGAFLELGQGTVDFAALVRQLEASHFTGWMTVELDGAVDPAASALRNRDYLVRRLGLNLSFGAAPHEAQRSACRTVIEEVPR